MSPNAEIRLARKGGVPIAAILSLKHRRTVVYKYGCSDEKFHHLAGMPFLFWKLIEESKDAGAEQIDFGRTDPTMLFHVAIGDRVRYALVAQKVHQPFNQHGVIVASDGLDHTSPVAWATDTGVPSVRR